MKKPLIPNLTDASAELAALETRRTDIDNERLKTQNLIAEAHEKMRTQNISNTAATKANKVASLLGDELQHVVVDKAQLSALYEKHAILEAAYNELNERINRERQKTGRLIFEKLQDYHSELVGNVVKNLADAHNAAIEYRKFKDEVESKGIGMAPLMPMSLSIVEKIGAFMNDAVRSGHVKKGAVPAGVLS
jgi:hypothetical protein